MMNMSIKEKTAYGIACPHCSGALRIRTSRAVAPTFRQLQMQCVDIECGATFGAEVSITHGIAPSMAPNPDVQLRMAPPRRRNDNDNHEGADGSARGSAVPPPGAANDDDGPAAGAVTIGG